MTETQPDKTEQKYYDEDGRLQSIKLGQTINTGNYNSLRLDVIVPRNPDESDDQLVERTIAKLQQVMSVVRAGKDKLELSSYAIDQLEDIEVSLTEKLAVLGDEQAVAVKGYYDVLNSADQYLRRMQSRVDEGRGDLSLFAGRVRDELGKHDGQQGDPQYNRLGDLLDEYDPPEDLED